MKRRGLLFIADILGELLLIELDNKKIYPDIITPPKDIIRKKHRSKILSYSYKFNITESSSSNINELIKNYDISKYDYLLAVGFSKDYFKSFHDSSKKVYHAHPSLLPKYRGYSAISEQFLRAVQLSGVTVYEATDIIDAGDIIYQKEIAIDLYDIPLIFIEKVAKEVANFIELLESDTKFAKVKQDEQLAFSTGRIRTKDMRIDFNSSAYAVHNFIRAFSYPFPFAYCYYNDILYYIPSAYIDKWSGSYGECGSIIHIDDNGIEIATGDGSIIVTEIADSNYNILSSDSFKVGEKFI